MDSTVDPVTSFVDAACVPLDDWHGGGTLERARAILAAHPEVGGANIYIGAILGDEAVVRHFLETDRAVASAKGGPRGWDPLTYLCFSRYLRLDPARSDSLVRTATALLDAGASANTGWFEASHEPKPVWESAIYGAAGIAKHAGLTRLLLERGADPNDEETPYHSPETRENSAVRVLVESGRLTEDSLAMILLRKTDWHDYGGVKYLLERGVDPNRQTRWGKTAIHNAVLSDNGIEIVEVLMDHRADPSIVARCPDRSDRSLSGRTAIVMAARRGRRDLLDLFEKRGFPIELQGVEQLIAACARDEGARVRSIVEREPQLAAGLRAEGGRLLAEFSGVGNADGVRQLLDLGVPVDERFRQGDGYFGIAKDSTALHVAAWRARHATVQLLVDRGAAVNARDAKERTPLMLAVKACVDSYWTDGRKPDSVAALLAAGASTDGVTLPTGYAEIDELLRAHMQHT